MGTVASTSAGIADLLQTLSNAGSPLASTLSSPALKSALQNGSPADIVKLSDEALQLQETEGLFGKFQRHPIQRTSLWHWIFFVAGIDRIVVRGVAIVRVRSAPNGAERVASRPDRHPVWHEYRSGIVE